MQSIKKGIISRFVSLGRWVIDSIGGQTNVNFISPYGLYSKPKSGSNCLVFQIIKDEGNKVILPLQMPVELNDGDIILTDNKSYIKFNFGTGIIEVSGETIFKNKVTFQSEIIVQSTITATGLISSSTDVSSAGISGKSHSHGGVQTGGGNTETPQ
jgi:hypothetical protein